MGKTEKSLEINFSCMPTQESNSIILVLGVEGGGSMNAINQLIKCLTSRISALYVGVWSTFSEGPVPPLRNLCDTAINHTRTFLLPVDVQQLSEPRTLLNGKLLSRFIKYVSSFVIYPHIGIRPFLGQRQPNYCIKSSYQYKIQQQVEKK